LCSTTLQSCQTRYEGTDAVINHLSNLIDRFSSASTSSEILNRSSVSEHTRRLETVSGGVVIRKDLGFGGVIQTKPRIYSHIVAALDIALSRGRMPQYDDFPISLRLMPRIDGLSTTPILSVFSSTLQDNRDSGIMGPPSAPTTLDPGLTQARIDSEAKKNDGGCQALIDISSQSVDLQYSQEDYGNAMLRQLLEGYAEAGLFTGGSVAM
jgi:hypothetical protein